jgi:hypothetical protein
MPATKPTRPPGLAAQIAVCVSAADLAALESLAQRQERSISFLIRRGIALVLTEQVQDDRH